MKVDVNIETHSVIQWLDSDSVSLVFITPLEQRGLNLPELASGGFCCCEVELLSAGAWRCLCCLFQAQVAELFPEGGRMGLGIYHFQLTPSCQTGLWSLYALDF